LQFFEETLFDVDSFLSSLYLYFLRFFSFFSLSSSVSFFGFYLSFFLFSKHGDRIFKFSSKKIL
jgi:hypothetical protein